VRSGLRDRCRFFGVVEGHGSTSSRGIEDVGWHLTTLMLGHKVWASRIVASLKRFSPSGKYRLNHDHQSLPGSLITKFGSREVLVSSK